MRDKTTSSRREALAFASLAAAFVIGSGTARVPLRKTGKATRPGAEEFARARRLYGGELGGFKRTG